MPAPPYDSAASLPTTAPTPTGAPYALSNIPAHIYLLQPRQPLSTTSTGGGKENSPSFMGQPLSSTPPVTSQPQFVPSYYTYPPPNMYQWPHAGVPNPMMPVAVPVHGFGPPNGSVASQSFPSQTSVHNEDTERQRPRSSSSRSSSRSTERGRRGDSSIRGHSRHTRDRSYDSSATETRYRPRRSATPNRTCRRRSSPQRSHRRRRRSQSMPKKVRAHLCTGCGRARSQKFHDANPFCPGKRAIINFCLKCRNLFDIGSDDEEVSDDQIERNTRAKV